MNADATTRYVKAVEPPLNVQFLSFLLCLNRAEVNMQMLLSFALLVPRGALQPAMGCKWHLSQVKSCQGNFSPTRPLKSRRVVFRLSSPWPNLEEHQGNSEAEMLRWLGIKVTRNLWSPLSGSLRRGHVWAGVSGTVRASCCSTCFCYDLSGPIRLLRSRRLPASGVTQLAGGTWRGVFRSHVNELTEQNGSPYQ